jgi:hypothetical protein
LCIFVFFCFKSNNMSNNIQPAITPFSKISKKRKLTKNSSNYIWVKFQKTFLFLDNIDHGRWNINKIIISCLCKPNYINNSIQSASTLFDKVGKKKKTCKKFLRLNLSEIPKSIFVSWWYWFYETKNHQNDNIVFV